MPGTNCVRRKMFQINNRFFPNPEKGKPVLIVDIRFIGHHHGGLPAVFFTEFQEGLNHRISLPIRSHRIGQAKSDPSYRPVRDKRFAACGKKE